MKNKINTSFEGMDERLRGTESGIKSANKISKPEKKPLTTIESQTIFIDSMAVEWARLIYSYYEKHKQLNFISLLLSMEKEFGNIPSLPAQFERVESSKYITNALDELERKIEEELGKITNQSQLTAIKRTGVIENLKNAIDSYKRKRTVKNERIG